MMRRSGVYYFKRRVPSVIARKLKLTSNQVWKSLNTTDLVVAKLKLNDELAEFGRLIDSAKDKAEPPSRPGADRVATTKFLLPEHIQPLLKRFEFFYLQTDDEERRALSREKREERLACYEEWLADLYDRAAADDFESMNEVAEQLLSWERLIAPPGSAVRQQLLKELLVKDIEVMEVQRNRLLGQVRLTPKDAPPSPRAMPTLLSVFFEWKKTQKEVRTIDTYHAYVGEFERLVGALPVASLSLRHAEKFRDELAERGLVRTTVKNRVDGLAMLLRYGLQKRLYDSQANPFADLDLDQVPARPEWEERRAYEVNELNQLFHSPVFTRGARPSGQAVESCYWAPILGPFVGSRLEEISQLRVEDVQRINGVWALRIANLDESQHLKTASSYRLVPLHDEVIQCGFLDYVEQVKKAGHQRVFPSHRNNNKYKRWGNALGKWYSGYLDDIGMDDERLCYQSFRFNFKQQLAVCGVEDEVKDALAGHWFSRSDPGRGYMRTPKRQYPFPVLVNAIQKLHYSDLGLTHLHVQSKPRP